MSECSGSCAVRKQTSLVSMINNRQYGTNDNIPATFNDLKLQQDGFEKYSALKPTICYLA